MSSNGGIFDGSKELLELLFDMNAFIIKIRDNRPKVCDVYFFIFDSKIWRLDVTVQLTKIMKLFNSV